MASGGGSGLEAAVARHVLEASSNVDLDQMARDEGFQLRKVGGWVIVSLLGPK